MRIPWSIAILSAGSHAPGKKAEIFEQLLRAANDNAVALHAFVHERTPC
jgi:hypothetical protein